MVLNSYCCSIVLIRLSSSICILHINSSRFFFNTSGSNSFKSVPPIITSSHKVQTNGLLVPFSSRQNNSSYLLFILSCTSFTGRRFSRKLAHCLCTSATVFMLYALHAVVSSTTITLALFNIVKRLRHVYSGFRSYSFL